MKFSPLEPFGAEVHGLDIRSLDDSTVEALERGLGENGFLVLREQAIEDSDFVAFLERLGPLTFTTGETPVEGAPMLNLVTNVGRTKPPRSVFHTDTSYVPEPPSYTALRVVVTPESGGETLFSDQYRAYESLPTSFRKAIAATKVRHAVTGLQLDADQPSETWHPLVRRHPTSGRAALFLSTPERCVELSDSTPEESARIIDFLFRHSIRPSRLYRHQWRTGDILVWDNRCTMHSADHSNSVGDRVLHRGLVLGEAPIPAHFSEAP